MTQTHYARTVETQFGQLRYNPSPLEELAEHFATQWEVKLPNLNPSKNFMDLRASTDGLVRKVDGDDFEIYYVKQGSEEVMRNVAEGLRTAFEICAARAKALYETDNPGEEYLQIRKGNKEAKITFDHNGRKGVEFVDHVAQNALNNARTAGLVYGSVDSNHTRMDFYGRGDSSQGVDRKIADIRAILGVVRLYFGS